MEFLKRIFGFRKPPKDSDNGVKGLPFLHEYTAPILSPKNLKSHEWRRKIVSPAGGVKFRVKYYGNLSKSKTPYITSKGVKPAKVIAEDVNTGEEILLFDLGLHGYSAMFGYNYSKDELANRPASNIYQLLDGTTELELFISADYSFDYEETDEFTQHVDNDGNIELVNGEKVIWDIAKRNACGSIHVWTFDASGKKVDIFLKEELD